MAKPILFYCLLRGGYGRGFKVLGVTTEKHRIVYGRDEDDGLTSASVRDVIHRFPEGTPLQFAKDASKRADAEAERHKVGLQAARDELSRLEDRKASAVLAAAKGTLRVTGSPAPRRTDVMLEKPQDCGYLSGCLCVGTPRGQAVECSFRAAR